MSLLEAAQTHNIAVRAISTSSAKMASKLYRHAELLHRQSITGYEYAEIDDRYFELDEKLLQARTEAIVTYISGGVVDRDRILELEEKHKNICDENDKLGNKYNAAMDAVNASINDIGININADENTLEESTLANNKYLDKVKEMEKLRELYKQLTDEILRLTAVD